MHVITLGLEEELQVVDASTFAHAPHNFEAGRKHTPDEFGSSSKETHLCVLEVQTPPCATADDLVRSLAGMRRVASARARSQGQLAIAMSLHPTSDWRKQAIRDDAQQDPHYARILDEYRDLSRALLVSGTHVHLGVERSDLRVAVLNGLREVLPWVLALSVSSPFYESRDTGIASWRHAILDRMPRMGICEPLANERAHWDHVSRLRATNCLSPDMNVWGDIRLHHRYPTIEVRILDVMPRLSRNWLVATLLQLEAQKLAEEASAGETLTPLPRELINENKWRVRRKGLEAQIVDWRSDREMPVQDKLLAWLDSLQPYAKAQGLQRRLEGQLLQALSEGDSSTEQRAVYRGAGYRGVLERLAEQTLEQAGGLL